MREKVYALIDALFPTEKSKRAALYEFASQATDMRDRIKELEEAFQEQEAAIREGWELYNSGYELGKQVVREDLLDIVHAGTRLARWASHNKLNTARVRGELKKAVDNWNKAVSDYRPSAPSPAADASEAGEAGEGE